MHWVCQLGERKRSKTWRGEGALVMRTHNVMVTRVVVLTPKEALETWRGEWSVSIVAVCGLCEKSKFTHSASVAPP